MGLVFALVLLKYVWKMPFEIDSAQSEGLLQGSGSDDVLAGTEEDSGVKEEAVYSPNVSEK